MLPFGMVGWGGSSLLPLTAPASSLSWLLPGGEHVVLGMQNRAACGFGDVKRADALMPGMQDFTEGFVQWSSGCRDVHLHQALVCVHDIGTCCEDPLEGVWTGYHMLLCKQQGRAPLAVNKATGPGFFQVLLKKMF